MTNDFANVGRSIKYLRTLKHWSLRELARRSGVSAALLSRAEMSQDWNMRLHNFKRVADALGVSMSELLDVNPPEPVVCPQCRGTGWITKETE